MGLRDRLRNLFRQDTVLASGDLAPELGLQDQEGKVWNLSDLRDRPAVLYFYPKDDTPGCTKEACSFRDNYTRLQSQATLLGISMDAPDSHRAFARKFNLPFPLLADTEGEVTHAWGVEGQFGFKKMPRRVTFILDKNGRIAKVIDPVKVEGHTEEVLRALDSLK
jgi:peroxiredoxin Q/BCP